MKEHQIYLIGGGKDESGVLTVDRRGDECWLSFLVRGERIEASADDFFEAFCHIRRQLETDSLIPFCYGASLNVYPSRMSRQMASGTVAYVLTPGVSAETRVHIFDCGPDVMPASVDNQKGFYADWLSSLRVRPLVFLERTSVPNAHSI
ncbi:MAG: hypothetical protein EON58_22210 [Alphaproteobacteria bacterium]|nr:MAG: hypothetical protein EON58_22210 [Alphaproteobacteria bacterium]